MDTNGMKILVTLLLVVFTCVALLGQPRITSAQDGSKQQDLVDQARMTFQSFMRDQNMTWLQENYDHARGADHRPRYG
jgi:hypothetical protein